MAYYLMHSGQPSARRLLRQVAKLQPYSASNTIDESDVVFRFGNLKESDPAKGLIHNSQNAVGRTMSRVNMGRFLRRVGVRFADKSKVEESGQNGVRFLRQYRVPVFDLGALAVFRNDSGPAWMNRRIQRVQDSFHEISFTDEKVTIRVIHLALRTIHALGLDFGLVSIGMASRGILHVIDVSPTPILEGRMLELYQQALNDFIAKDDSIERSGFGPVNIGTDMELMLRNEAGKMVLASKYFTRKGRVGCDDRSVQFDGKRLPLLELRPDPEPNPLSLVQNLRETMVEAVTAIGRSKVELRAGSMPFRPYCTGGHIHFSNVPYSSRLVRQLDAYVGVPLMLVEDAKTAILRRPRYGFLGDIRMKDYGGFEYRTPASFVVDADVTAAALCLAYVVAVHHRELPMFDIYDPAMQTSFYRHQREAFIPIVEKASESLRGLSMYERYRDHIEPLWTMIREGRSWDEGGDVKKTWGISVVRRPVVRANRSRLAGRVTG